MRSMPHCRRLFSAKACDEGAHSTRIELRPLRPLLAFPSPFGFPQHLGGNGSQKGSQRGSQKGDQSMGG